MQQRTNEEKEELVQLYKQSGMSARAFAKEFEINLGTFRNWLYKKPSKNISTDNNYKFVKVETNKLSKCTDNQNIRIQKNGMEIFIPVDILTSYSSIKNPNNMLSLI